MESGRPLENDVPQIEDKMTSEERSRVIERLAGRFIGMEAGPSKLPALNTGLRQKVVSDIVEKLRAIQPPITEEGGARVPLGLVSRTEWGVLLDEMAARDGRDAENLMDLMSVSHVACSWAMLICRYMVLIRTESKSRKSWSPTPEMVV
jgi:hypothetical protein